MVNDCTLHRIKAIEAAYPDATVLGLVNRVDGRRGGKKFVELTVFELRERAARPNPEAAVVARSQGFDEAVFESL